MSRNRDRDEASPAIAPAPAVAASSRAEAPGHEMDDPMAVKYALELAAHRDTTQRLLEEKDRTIAAQQALITELRAKLRAPSE